MPGSLEDGLSVVGQHQRLRGHDGPTVLDRDVIPPGPPGAYAGTGPFAVRLRLLNGDPVFGVSEVTVCDGDNVGVFLDAITKVSGTGRWQLFYDNKELETGKPVGKYGMVDGSTVFALITHEGVFERNVKGVLNTIPIDVSCQEVPTLIDRFDLVRPKNRAELRVAVDTIFHRILDEPQRCETFADILVRLSSRFPTFPPDKFDVHDRKSLSVRRHLLMTCEVEFERLCLFKMIDGRGPLPDQERHALALMKFVGHLFLREMVAVKVIGQILDELLCIRAGGPQDLQVKCTCELMGVIGTALEETDNGKLLMAQLITRLLALWRTSGQGQEVGFSRRSRTDIHVLVHFLRPNVIPGDVPAEVLDEFL